MNRMALSDRELLAELIGPREAKRLYRGSLSMLLRQPDAEHEHGTLVVVRELMQRALLEELVKGETIRRGQQVEEYLRLMLCGKEHEAFIVFLLTSHHQLLKVEQVSRGTLSQAPVYPREVVKLALRHNAGAVIFAHNHPSGNAEPSAEDMVMTRKLTQALALVDVRVLDHFVVAGNTCLSFAERGLLRDF